MRKTETPEGRSVRLLRVAALQDLAQHVPHLLADESFDEGGRIDQLLRAPKVAQDLDEE